MGLFKNYVSQTRKPEGFLGKMMVFGMNGGHAKLADWGMSHLENITPASIAELGCGGGRNVAELLKRYPGAHLTALDYSETSVQKAKTTNNKAIAAGRCTVLRENVASLPFDGGSFDLATAFETIYFWPNLEKCFTEIIRVLKPGGSFLICNESDGTDAATLRYAGIIDGMNYYTHEQLTDVLRAAGFSKIRTRHHKNRPWITVLAEK